MTTRNEPPTQADTIKKRGGSRPGAGRKPQGGRLHKLGQFTLSPKALAIIQAIPKGMRSAYVDEAILERDRLLGGGEIPKRRTAPAVVIKSLGKQAPPVENSSTD